MIVSEKITNENMDQIELEIAMKIVLFERKLSVQVNSRANKPAPRGGKLVEVDEEETGANQRKRQGVIK